MLPGTVLTPPERRAASGYPRRSPARQKRWTLLDRLTFVWCVACFGIHFVLEGYFAVNNRTITTDMSFLGQVCTQLPPRSPRATCLACANPTAVGVG